MAKLMAVVRISEEMLDMIEEDQRCELITSVFSDDILGCVRASVRSLRKQAAEAGVKPSQFLNDLLRSQYLQPDDAVFIERTEKIKLGMVTDEK